jgi:outer membrane receptor protein involved in Fe transport
MLSKSARTVLLAVLSPIAFARLAAAQPAPDEPPASDEPTPPMATEPGTDEVAADEDDPARPPPAGKGVVWGIVTDSASAEALIDAQVSVVGGSSKAIADVDGRFRLELAPGTYQLRIWYELHQARRVQNVRVTAGQVTRINVALEPDKTAEDVVEIEAAPDRASAEAQLMLRKSSAAAGDAVSAQEIARSPDRNAADAARRVVGASVVGGKYVYVRGLGDRYTNALLNGAPLPSPEPDRQAVPLDLFPSLVISDITIAKTFTPDMPGDFAGGSVRITTRELPESLLLQATVSAGLNTESTFADRLSYRGSSMDWLGIDGGARALPEGIPPYKVIRLGAKPDGSTISRDELTAYGKKMNAYMSTEKSTNLPNLSGSVVVGDSVTFAGDQRLGGLLALSYGRRFTRRVDTTIRTFAPHPTEPDALVTKNEYTAETGRDQVAWSGLATVAHRFGKDHQISLTGVHSRSSDNEARTIQGHSEEAAADIEDTRLRFISRSLTFGQLRGQHTIRPANGATLDWNLSLSHATADEPDTRENVYVHDDTLGTKSWDEGTLSGLHFFGNQRETAYGGGLDWTQPVVRGTAPISVKLGGLFNLRRRTFSARRFHYVKRDGTDPGTYRLPPDELFTDGNIGTALELEEFTKDDAYDAALDVFAVYAMADVALHPRFRVVVGERVEVADQSTVSFDPTAQAGPDEVGSRPPSAETSNTDLLPSLGLIWKVTPDANLRFSVARTVARPQLRELAPILYTDYFGGRELLGNPDLQRSRIYHADLRFELFPSRGDVAAVSVFYKHFEDPIEQVTIPTSGRGTTTFQNADSANNIGAELELRKSLGFASPALADFGVLANVTLVRSRVTLDASQLGNQTNDIRPLAGQSPFVVNAGLDYASDRSGTRARLLYNVFGARIESVGARGLPDQYEQPRHQLDATVAQRIGEHVDLKLSAENILDQPVRSTQGEEDSDAALVGEYRTGTTVTLGITVSN